MTHYLIIETEIKITQYIFGGCMLAALNVL